MKSGVHTNHADYEAALRAWLVNKWDEITDKADSLDDQLGLLHIQLERLTSSIQKGLSEKSIKGTTKGTTNVNDLFGVKASDLPLVEQKPELIKAVENLLSKY